MKRLNMVIVFIIVIFFLGNFKTINAYDLDGKIHKNVYVESLDLSGLTKKEAHAKIEKIIKNNNMLYLYNGDKKYSIKLHELNINYEINKMVESAYNVGRDKGIISDVKTRVKLDLGEKHIINFLYSYEDESIENYINYINKEISIEPVDSTIKIEKEKIVVEREKYGVEVDKNKLKSIILEKVKKMSFEEEKIPTIGIEPTHLYKDLSKIDTILGSYETKFNGKNFNRVNNIRVAAEATNNKLISQYEEFSFNNYTSNESVISKFKEAPVIRNGNLEKGLGGGICQVSTTIYNAALYAGLEITNIKNHSLPSAYISKGRDATVSDGGLDLKFRNIFKTPVFINNKVYEDKVVSVIYGSKDDKQNIEVVTEMVDTIPNKTKIIESENLYIGEKKIKSKGRVGYKVNTFRIYKKNDGLTKEFIHESYYPPQDKEILKGIKPKSLYTEFI